MRPAVWVGAAAILAVALGVIATGERWFEPEPPPAAAQTADVSDPNFQTPAATETDDSAPDHPFDHTSMSADEADIYYNDGPASRAIIEKLTAEAGQVDDEYYGIAQDTVPLWLWLFFGFIALVSAARHAQREKESYAAALHYVFTSKLFRWPDGLWDFIFKASGLLGLITSAVQVMQWLGLFPRF